MSDLRLSVNSNTNINTNSIDNGAPIDPNDKKNDLLLDNKIQEKQKELTTQELFENLKTDLDGKKPSKAPKIIERIIGGVLLGAAVVAAVAVTLASCGVATVVAGAVVGALGGVLATSITAGAAGLAGIGTLVHCGLSKSSAEAYAAGELSALMESVSKNAEKMPPEVGKIAKSIAYDRINELLQNLPNFRTDKQRKDAIQAAKDFINTKLNIMSKFVDTNQADMSVINNYCRDSQQEYVDKQVAQNKSNNDFCDQFFGDLHRESWTIGGVDFERSHEHEQDKVNAIKNLFPDPKTTFFLSWIVNQNSMFVTNSLLTSDKESFALLMNTDVNKIPNCISEVGDGSSKDDNELKKGFFIREINSDNGGLGHTQVDKIEEEQVIDGKKQKITKAVITKTKNWGVEDTFGLRGGQPYGCFFTHTTFVVDVTNPDDIKIVDAKVSISADAKPHSDVVEKNVIEDNLRLV